MTRYLLYPLSCLLCIGCEPAQNQNEPDLFSASLFQDANDFEGREPGRLCFHEFKLEPENRAAERIPNVELKYTNYFCAWNNQGIITVNTREVQECTADRAPEIEGARLERSFIEDQDYLAAHCNSSVVRIKVESTIDIEGLKLYEKSTSGLVVVQGWNLKHPDSVFYLNHLKSSNGFPVLAVVQNRDDLVYFYVDTTAPISRDGICGLLKAKLEPHFGSQMKNCEPQY